MKKRIRGVYLKKILPLAIALLVAAAALFAATGFGAFKSFGEAPQLNKLASEELKGARAYARIADIIGEFAVKPKSVDSEGNIVEYKARYCVYKTDAGDYLGICIRGKTELINAAQYVSALEAYSTEELAQFNMGTVEGTVGRIEDYLYDMLRSAVQKSAGEGEEFDEAYLDAHVLPLVLENGYLGTMPRPWSWALTIIGLLLAASAVVYLCACLTGYWEKPRKALVSELGREAAEKTFDEGEDFGRKLRIGPERIFVAGKLVTDVVKTDEVIWTYGRSRRLEGGGNFWSLVIKTTEGGEFVAPVGDAGTAQAALEKIVSFGGPVVTGFDKDKQRLYERDLTGFIGRARKLFAEQKLRASEPEEAAEDGEPEEE
jgi:hypothetical protein